MISPQETTPLRGGSPTKFFFLLIYSGDFWVKSSLRAMERASPSAVESLRFSLFGGLALTAGPGPIMSTLPSTSSRGDTFLAGFGSLDG